MLLAVSCAVAFILGAVACAMLHRYAWWWLQTEYRGRSCGDARRPEPWLVRVCRWIYEVGGDC